MLFVSLVRPRNRRGDGLDATTQSKVGAVESETDGLVPVVVAARALVIKLVGLQCRPAICLDVGDTVDPTRIGVAVGHDADTVFFERVERVEGGIPIDPVEVDWLVG